jgi:hypothetical protein
VRQAENQTVKATRERKMNTAIFFIAVKNKKVLIPAFDNSPLSAHESLLCYPATIDVSGEGYRNPISIG